MSARLFASSSTRSILDKVERGRRHNGGRKLVLCDDERTRLDFARASRYALLFLLEKYPASTEHVLSSRPVLTR
jgi:hypothetical protein